jgi:peroxiredoxin Q/BCP
LKKVCDLKEDVTMVEEGEKAPDFCLQGTNELGKSGDFCLKDLLKEGKQLILYFYPKDNTPGCTTEACDFRDNYNRLLAKATVVGVSPDNITSHKEFREKHSLNFHLLSDPQKKVLSAYGAWGEKTMYGKTTTGVIRSTFLIGPDAIVKKAWRNVKAKGHVEKVLSSVCP